MVDESLLTDDVRALIGKRTPAVRVQVTKQAAERAMETYFGHPVKLDAADGADAPGYVIAGLNTGGESVQFPPLLPADLLISNEWSFERPLRFGEWLEASQSLADVNERFGGQFGYALNVRTEIEFRDASGAVVARSTNTMMQYDPKAKRGGDE